MPTPFQLLSLAAASAIMLACTGVTGTSNAATRPTTQTVTPNNKTFTIARAETFTIVLPSAGAGGYQWHLADSVDKRVVRLKGTRVGELPANSPPGRFADEIFDFEGLAAGSTTIVLLNYRSWEGPSQAIETRTYPVTVR